LLFFEAADDVMADGKRLLINTAGSADPVSALHLTLVTNWLEAVGN